MALSGFEKFSIYGFSINYPIVCRVEFNPKSRREVGDVVFHFPDREKIIISWGDLGKAKKKSQTVEAQAEHSIEMVKKSSQLKNLERVAQDSLEINSHKAPYNSIRLDEMAIGLFRARKRATRQVHSVHVHCDPSSRYFVIYTHLPADAPDDFGELLLEMVRSFKCH